MKINLKFLIIAMIVALVIFPVWRFMFQKIYIIVLGKTVAPVASKVMGSKIEMYDAKNHAGRQIPVEAGEIAFDLYKFRRTIVVDLSSIVTNIVPLLALVIATSVSRKKKILGVIIGLAVAFFSHILATLLIINWQISPDSRIVEGAKVFMDGMMIAAVPLVFWIIWAEYAVKGGVSAVIRKK